MGTYTSNADFRLRPPFLASFAYWMARLNVLQLNDIFLRLGTQASLETTSTSSNPPTGDARGGAVELSALPRPLVPERSVPRAQLRMASTETNPVRQGLAATLWDPPNTMIPHTAPRNLPTSSGGTPASANLPNRQTGLDDDADLYDSTPPASPAARAIEEPLIDLSDAPPRSSGPRPSPPRPSDHNADLRTLLD